MRIVRDQNAVKGDLGRHLIGPYEAPGLKQSSERSQGDRPLSPLCPKGLCEEQNGASHRERDEAFANGRHQERGLRAGSEG